MRFIVLATGLALLLSSCSASTSVPEPPADSTVLVITYLDDLALLSRDLRSWGCQVVDPREDYYDAQFACRLEHYEVRVALSDDRGNEATALASVWSGPPANGSLVAFSEAEAARTFVGEALVAGRLVSSVYYGTAPVVR